MTDERRAKRWLSRGRRRALLIGVALALLAVVAIEVRSSVASARAGASRSRALTYTVETGPAERPLPAPSGPYDLRLGYARLPAFVDSARGAGFGVARQARPSLALDQYVGQRRFNPPFAEKSTAGLTILDRSGRALYTRRYPRSVLPTFESIPSTLVDALLWIEDRELLSTRGETRNPALDWDRLARAILDLGISTIDRDRNVPGGSTLATQIEKFRHSEGGRTSGVGDKLRQVVSASVRAYRDGPTTLAARRRIVLDYLNSMPLAAHPRLGEVTGIGDGLEAWFGVSPAAVWELIGALGSSGPRVTPEQARAYRMALTLILSVRRPSYYLASAEGPERLADLTEQHLRRFREEGLISSALADSALARRVVPAPAPLGPGALEPLEGTIPERKTLGTIRGRLAALLGVEGAYALDRLDLRATATMDSAGQAAAAGLLADLRDPAYLRARGISGLLGRGDPERVVYSILVVESTPQGNAVRIDVDNFPGAASLNDAGRLELGSTAKLRTLVTYLETVSEAFDRLSAMPPDSLSSLDVHPRDGLTRWVLGQRRARPTLTREEIVAEAMNRRFRADPGQRFMTGGGVQTFRNFDARFDASTQTVREGFRHSINLVFVRVLREVVDHRIFAPWSPTSRVLASPDSIRRPYLVQFARNETRTYLRRFHAKYGGLSADEILEALLENRRSRPRRAAWSLRWVVPELEQSEFERLLRGAEGGAFLERVDLEREYRLTDPSRFNLLDAAYLAGVHPLELWVARFLRENPDAVLERTLSEGEALAEQVYRWLIERSSRTRQDPRIYSVLEEEAFQRIHQSWRRLGYPFRNLVPSVGTAIGSSGDRPDALAELAGIILNDGLRLPLTYVGELEFAAGTPYEVALTRRPAVPTRVMSAEVARVVKDAMLDVVRNGTARRAAQSFRDSVGAVLPVGGKTGTGDNRSRSASDGPGAAVTIRNRTASLVFFAGDNWFGMVTVFVPGSQAASYGYTSALASQVLVELGARWSPARVAAETP